MRPAIDFDLKSPFAFFYTLGVMCKWTPDRHRRARANLAPGLMGVVFERMLPLMERLGEVAKQGVPPSGTLRRIATEYLKSESLVEEFLAFGQRTVSDVREAVPGIPQDMDGEEVFWRTQRIPGRIPHEKMLAAIPWQELVSPKDGIAAMGRAPGIEAIEAEIDTTLKSDASFAGLILVLAATLDIHHQPLSASVNRASYVLGSERVMGQRARTMRHVIKTWTKWRPVAPLWAGAIVVSKDWEGDSVLRVIADDESRNRVLSTAKWFANFATQHKAKRAVEPLIPADEVVQMPESMVPERPNLSPLDGAALEEARAYEAPTREYFNKR